MYSAMPIFFGDRPVFEGRPIGGRVSIGIDSGPAGNAAIVGDGFVAVAAVERGSLVARLAEAGWPRCRVAAAEDAKTRRALFRPPLF